MRHHHFTPIAIFLCVVCPMNLFAQEQDSSKDSAHDLEREHMLEELQMERWRDDLGHELESMQDYLREVPSELSGYFEDVQNAMRELVRSIEERLSAGREMARSAADEADARVHDYERRLHDARMLAEHKQFVRSVRKRAEQSEDASEIEPLIAELEDFFESGIALRDRIEAMEEELGRHQKEEELLRLRIERRFLEIETERLERELAE